MWKVYESSDVSIFACGDATLAVSYYRNKGGEGDRGGRGL